MHCMDNIRKGAEDWGVLFAVYKLIVFENRAMGMMCELKADEMGRKGCILWSFIVHTACKILGYQGTVAKGVRNVACMGVKVILKRVLIGKQEGKSPFRRPV